MKKDDNFFTEEEVEEQAEMLKREREEREAKEAEVNKGFTITCNNCGSTDVMDGEHITKCKCGNTKNKNYWNGYIPN